MADTTIMMSNMTRSIPAWLAPVVEQLELDQPSTVTVAELREILASIGSSARAADVARRLRERGWLLPTGVRGVYEFAPGSHAGAIGRADPFQVVRATLAAQPGSPIVVALGSAAWVHGLADRAPDILEVALPSTGRLPAAIRKNARSLVFDAQLESENLKGVPTQSLATMLVHMAAKPRDVRSWSAAAEWLHHAAAEAGDERMAFELEGRPEAVGRRLGYLLQGVHPEFAAQLRGSSAGKVWFGQRGKLRRNNEEWGIADTVLPFDPRALKPEKMLP